MKLTTLLITLFISLGTLAQNKDSVSHDVVKTVEYEDSHFPGGQEALKAFIKSNLTIIDLSLCQNSGIVYVQMEVDSTGKISNLKIKRGVKREFDEEALRLFRIMPNWIPMICNGTPKKSDIIIPVTFSPM